MVSRAAGLAWGWSLVAAVLLGTALPALLAPSASAADNVLVVSEPRVREQLDRPPGFVTMAFRDAVDPSLAKMLVQDALGTNVTVGELIVEGTNMSTQLRDGLAQGTYTVTYRLNRPDGEPQGGTFQFSYGPGTFTAEAETTWSGSPREPEVLKNPDPNAVTPTAPTSSAPTTEPTATTATPSPTPSPTPGPSSVAPSPTASAATPEATTSPTPSPDPASGRGTTVLVLIAVGVLVLTVVALLIARWLQRRGAELRS